MCKRSLFDTEPLLIFNLISKEQRDSYFISINTLTVKMRHAHLELFFFLNHPLILSTRNQAMIKEPFKM